MTRIPIALQLFSVRQDCERDLPGTLEAVAKMGYEGVEFAGYYGHEAAQIKKMLDDLGLKCAGTHTGIGTLEGDELQRTIEFNRVLDNAYLIVPWLGPERYASREAWIETANFFGQAAQRAGEAGCFVGYHNHDFEFSNTFDGQTLMDVFAQNTPDEVVVQLDTGNAVHGGGDATQVLERYPTRARTIHLKEYSHSNDKALLGEGEVPWQKIFQVCENNGATQWYIVEQESYALPPLECVDKCLQNLKAMGK
ncbi:MAG TPA: sugar phosphate isomerase/epimerase [Abditibacteriaceae bacterium]|jgi:sugar phosphate isomerase/epimerase